MGCLKTINTTGTNCVPCEALEIIYISRNDTKETQKQVIIQNDVIEAICTNSNASN